ncbi:hypothetical protein BLNAU_7834 [Blattamonas nauphoetae]|uniref:Uncharacterized protein n=1 Tax=Blattamonas nauphoetae TaxID=2049346 RepID=A0ABQ9Y0I4_9EUKA|nr:hypothetical protein BLNAU_7834 [Blattamonas nauphoetae]
MSFFRSLPSQDFTEYIKQCPLHSIALQETKFELSFKGRHVFWTGLCSSLDKTEAMFIVPVFPLSKTPNVRLIIPGRTSKKIDPFTVGSSSWFFGRLESFDIATGIVTVVLEHRQQNLKHSFISLQKLYENIGPRFTVMEERLFNVFWKTVSFSVIGVASPCVSIPQLPDDAIACFDFSVVEPFHDNENDPVRLEVAKGSERTLFQVNDSVGKHLEILVQPKDNSGSYHIFRLVGILRCLPTSYTPPVVIDVEPYEQSTADEPLDLHGYHNVSPASSHHLSPDPIPLMDSTQPRSISPSPSPVPSISSQSSIYSPIESLSIVEQHKAGFLCNLTGKVMTHVSFLPSHPKVYYEFDDLADFIKRHGVSPLTFNSIALADIRENVEQQKLISLYYQSHPLSGPETS